VNLFIFIFMLFRMIGSSDGEIDNQQD
jgi:hypothetical protein